MAKHAPGFLKIVNDAKIRVKECTIDDVKARLDAGEKMLLVDVREESEWNAGHLPGAIHLGKGVIERDIDERHLDGRRISRLERQGLAGGEGISQATF
jgi:rhodanese-related sulfurtransferase